MIWKHTIAEAPCRQDRLSNPNAKMQLGKYRTPKRRFFNQTTYFWQRIHGASADRWTTSVGKAKERAFIENALGCLAKSAGGARTQV